MYVCVNAKPMRDHITSLAAQETRKIDDQLCESGYYFACMLKHVDFLFKTFVLEFVHEDLDYSFEIERYYETIL